MWTVAEYLPRDCLQQPVLSDEEDVEIDGQQKLVTYDFYQSWLRPKLRHRHLTTVVRQMEGFGLGTMNDILFCMVPSLSFKDLLPDNTMLKLMPQLCQNLSRVDAARFYRYLLSTPIGPDEKYCYAVIVAVMDFLFVACTPYDANLTPPKELDWELGFIIQTLASPPLSQVLNKLAPVYELQGRRARFLEIFQQYHSRWTQGKDHVQVYSNPSLEIAADFLETKLGFSEGHMKLYRATKWEREKSLVNNTGAIEISTVTQSGKSYPSLPPCPPLLTGSTLFRKGSRHPRHFWLDAIAPGLLHRRQNPCAPYVPDCIPHLRLGRVQAHPQVHRHPRAEPPSRRRSKWKQWDLGDTVPGPQPRRTR